MTLLTDLETVTFTVRKGEKGRLITAQTNPRQRVDRDCWDEFQTALGSEEKALDMRERFRHFNRKNKHERSMADGMVYALI